MADTSDKPGFASRASAWLAHPFNEQMDFKSWVLFAVFLATIVVLWLGILRAIMENNAE